jgi:hypothetical protein
VKQSRPACHIDPLPALPLTMFVASCEDIYEAHWVIAESEEAAELLLDVPDWYWQTLGPDETLTEIEDDEHQVSMPVRDWIAKNGRGHLSWSEIG